MDHAISLHEGKTNANRQDKLNLIGKRARRALITRTRCKKQQCEEIDNETRGDHAENNGERKRRKRAEN
ncbi:hypothetical protein DENSPDRAFT_838227 [Dentipellis sp. KUC8613]|nr:hypothetical protein DENSPDRAFT_838227 [Dentipellis sp. KUC8613]